MTKKRKILVFLEAKTMTGPLKVTLATHNALKEWYEFYYCEYVRKGQNSTEFSKLLKEKNLNRIEIFENGAFSLKAIKKIFHVLNEMRPSVVESHNIKSTLYLSFVIQILNFLDRTKIHDKMSYLIFFHGITFEDLKQRFYNFLFPVILFFSPQYTFCTVAEKFILRYKWATLFSAKAKYVLANAIESKEFYQACEAKRLERKATIQREIYTELHYKILILGRYSKEKGQIDFLESFHHFEKIFKEIPNSKIEIRIVGGGPDFNKAQQLISSKSIKQVELIEHTNNPMEHLKWANIGLITSRSEGHPLVSLEYMLEDMIILTTRVGLLSERLINSKNVIFIDLYNLEKSKKDIIMLLSDHKKYRAMANENTLLLREEFSIDNRAAQLLAIYKG